MDKADSLGAFEQLVLAALLHLGDKAYGASIRREIEERTGRDSSLGAIYTTLDRLEDKGFVSSRMGEATPERGGRPKRYFKIKAPGLKAFNEARVAMGRMYKGLGPEAA
jgi:DNA-binding PadR family transcriptional regulator